MFVVSPSNSNQGSNVMVVWPSGAGITPGDSASDDYYVDPPVSVEPQRQSAHELTLYPNPSTDGTVGIRAAGLRPLVERIDVFAPNGQLLGQYPSLPEELNLPAANSGLHQIVIHLRNGERLSRRWLILK